MDISGLLLQTFGTDITFISSNFRSLCSPDLSNFQCRLVEPSIPIVTRPNFGATIPWLLAAPYELISDISEPNNLYYIIIKVSHKFGKKVHDQVHQYAAKLEIVSANLIDVIWLGDDCTDLFSISDFMFRYDILCCHIKEHSYDSPSSPKDELQGASPHSFCLHRIENMIHDQGIYNKYTKFFTKN